MGICLSARIKAESLCHTGTNLFFLFHLVFQSRFLRLCLGTPIPSFRVGIGAMVLENLNYFFGIGVSKQSLKGVILIWSNWKIWWVSYGSTNQFVLCPFSAKFYFSGLNFKTILNELLFPPFSCFSHFSFPKFEVAGFELQKLDISVFYSWCFWLQSGKMIEEENQMGG